MIAIFIIIGVVVLLAIYFIVLYNRLVRMRNDMSNAWAQIEVQLKRRHDLIPNLVETVKGYAAHERETLDAVTNARNMAQSAVGKGAVAENYPDLKANQNFLSLQGELSSTENKIASSRMDYNDMVLHCNNTIQTVPSNIVAGLTGFKPGEFFELETPEEKDTPSISFT